MIEVKKIIQSIDVRSTGDYQVFNKLMRKFELDKKIFSCYDDKLKKPVSSKELGKKDYEQLAICFLMQAVKHEDIRFYNTALKVRDTTGTRLPEIKFVE
jgi:hypothetical protein